MGAAEDALHSRAPGLPDINVDLCYSIYLFSFVFIVETFEFWQLIWQFLNLT